MLLTGLTLLFLLLYAALIGYYHTGWKRLPAYEPGDLPPGGFVTVVVPARNESARLRPLLQALKEQRFEAARFEVILVDDYSTDDTVAQAQAAGLAQLKIIRPQVPPALSSKKKAIEAAVREARGELIVCTDADCLPGADWLRTVYAFYRERQAAFIAAPVQYRHTGTMLSLFQCLDFMTLQGITAAGVHRQFHTMCNGANLAYTKAAFEAVNGFEGIDRLASGDDMLLMHKIWKQHRDRVWYLKSEAAIVRTAPMQSWKAFFSQRIRWASKSGAYDDHRITAVLVFIYLLNALFIVLLVQALRQPPYWWLAAGYLAGKTLIELPFVASVARFYREQRLLKYFPFFQPLHILYTVVIGLLSQTGTYEWKGRRTK
jgi:cellulose synthase/poly-beta-1,6-N-acetylglucosamine synthase-like glycosyltransferase